MHDFRPLIIASTHRETAEALSVTLVVPEALRAAFRFRPGQHLAFRAVLNGEELRRTYSICSGPDDQHLTVTIKRVPGGRFSSWAAETLHPGMTIDAMPPAGRFVLAETPSEKTHILAFAAGAGITPIMAMAEHAMRRQPSSRFTLIYGNRDVDSIIFRERLENLKDSHLDRFALLHVLSRNEETDTPLLEGRITADKVSAFAGHIFDVRDIDQAFLCGPGTMIREVRNALIALGMPRERVHHEFFAPAAGTQARTGTAETARPGGTLAAPSPGNTPTAGQQTDIVAIVDGKRHRFTARPGEVVVDAALRAGVRAPYACKGGMCSTCRARVVEGRVTMRVNYSLEPWEIEKGFVLTCQALAETDRLVVDYDQM